MTRAGPLAVALLTLAPGAALSTAPEAAGREIHELHIRVGSATIRALCTDGRRQVLLLHDVGSSADSWRPVLERLDGRVGACAYDRPGHGGSSAAPPQRGWYELLDELRRIHLALGFDRGYVLAGVSVGGLYARLFAADRGGDVSGLVLLDPAHEDLPREARSGMPEEAWSAWMQRRQAPNGDGVTEAAVAERARRSRLENLPITVVSATVRPDDEVWSQRFLNEAARRVHATILHGALFPRHIPAPNSGPDVHRDAPQLVADEIVRVVRLSGARGGSPEAP